VSYNRRMETIIGITDSAAQRIHHLQEQEGNPGLRFRLTVMGGGCSGFQYQMDLDDQKTADDVTFEKNGVEIVTDSLSLQYLKGSTLDFIESLSGSSFEIKNPNATASCGCGSSFSV